MARASNDPPRFGTARRSRRRVDRPLSRAAPARRAAAIEACCEQHPDLGPALRQRLAFLEDCGLIDGTGETKLERLGDYRLLHRIGHGGMGVVYLAEQERMARMVALKLIDPALAGSARLRERFLREVRAVASLEHANICPVYDAGEVDGVRYIAMRYVEGETLAQRIGRLRATGQRPDIAAALAIGESIANALDTAHARGIVHRDVKPDNIMLEREGGQALLLDFGLAQLGDAATTRLTAPGDPIGTPAYMAPEQVSGAAVDRRTDVYGLGATLYEAVTFRVPHEAPTREALYRRILGADVSSAGRHNRDVPSDLDVVLTTAMQRDPAQRYATAADLAGDLRRVRDGLPIQARPPGLARRTWTMLRRHPLMAMAAVALAVIASLSVTLLAAWREIGLRPDPGGRIDGPRLVPEWSTFFGGPGSEESIAVLRGPGDLVTIVGETTSVSLGPRVDPLAATPPAGDYDAFVARFDVSQPAAPSLVWCTRIGGVGRDSALDAAVDPVSGATTIVGTTAADGMPGTAKSAGANDGFVIRLGADGRTIEAADLFGGAADDRICEVEIAPDGTVFVAGITESDDLPACRNAHHGGPQQNRTDAFVARLEPAGAHYRVTWTVYLGGQGPEGQSVASWRSSHLQWVGNIDWVAMARSPDGALGITMQSAIGDAADAQPAWTAEDAPANAPAGAADAYFAVVDSQTRELGWATFFGGSRMESPKAIAVHPDGGFVVAGATWSPDLPRTEGCLQPVFRAGMPTLDCDGFVAWIDPRRGRDALRYSTYLGGTGGQDTICALACCADGSVVAAGFSCGGDLPLTHFLQPILVRHSHGGVIAHLAMRGHGERDLRFATIAAGPGKAAVLFEGIALDGDGTLWVTGISTEPGFPVRHPIQRELSVGDAQRDGVLMRLRIPGLR